MLFRRTLSSAEKSLQTAQRLLIICDLIRSFVYNFSETFQILFIIAQIRPAEAVDELAIFFPDITDMKTETDAQIEPLHIFAALQDISAVFLHIIIGTSPEGQQIVDDLLQLQQRRRRPAARSPSCSEPAEHRRTYCCSAPPGEPPRCRKPAPSIGEYGIRNSEHQKDTDRTNCPFDV